MIITILFSADTCEQPTFNRGTTEPDQATVVIGEAYTVICNSGSTMTSGTPIMKCESKDTFDQRPMCGGIQFIVLLIALSNYRFYDF